MSSWVEKKKNEMCAYERSTMRQWKLTSQYIKSKVYLLYHIIYEQQN